jgi:hypothetical protein
MLLSLIVWITYRRVLRLLGVHTDYLFNIGKLQCVEELIFKMVRGTYSALPLTLLTCPRLRRLTIVDGGRATP